MNSSEKGDQFEERSYNLIQKTIESGELGLIASHCRVFRKKGYYSTLRRNEIFFDLTIEIWPPGAERFVILFVIECKDLSTKVPVDDVEEFYTKVNQIADLNGKGVFISSNGFQKGAFQFAESTGMMLIQLNYDESHQIILHKINRSKVKTNSIENDWKDNLRLILENIFNLNSRIKGIKPINRETIEKMTRSILIEYNPDIINYFKSLPIEDFIEYLKREYDLSLEFRTDMGMDSKGNDILGYFQRSRQTIYIHNELRDSNRFLFVFCHELGHFFLHKNLILNQALYELEQDSRYNFSTDKHDLKNDRNWIEWQANQFSASLILPEASILARLVGYQQKEGIPHKGRIYVDHQPINQLDYGRTITFLSSYFNVTKKNVIYRLKQLGILTYAQEAKHISRVDLNYFEGD